jgi:hypothetical protein
VGLGPWWTMVADGWRTSPALSARLPWAIGAHRGGGKRERTQWVFSPKSKSAGVMMDRGWRQWGVEVVAVTTRKWRGWAIVALDALETGEAGVPFIGADGESNGRKRMGHRWW